MIAHLPKQITDNLPERASNDSEFRESGEYVPENRVLALIQKNEMRASQQKMANAAS